MKNMLVVLIPIVFLFACTSEQAGQSTLEQTETPITEPDVVTEESTDLMQYFLNDNSTAKFRGEGNEYAAFTLKTYHLFDNYVATYEDNGGTVMRRYYKISPTEITLIDEQGEAYEVANPTLQELQAMETISVYLKTPLEVGTEFDGWKITSSTTTVETDLQTFANVLVLEKIDDQGNLMRKYFAKGFGEIKREYMSTNEEEPFTISSIIEKIE
ncbi:hypothetical protein SAMN05518871_103233 [Psychrobacillus sp. OK028]|uniref:hypothetical protein n=1 Tax=Psychrobacillus sp. OK028 TaxID=1884359 RepID=UPI00088A5C9B|nr:hypothetical protein [Psychrobacillus sp. OK028]SDN08067.1 hypothetical protein SAMN05518871_103233 [Psychrobacillus sp. OK028]